MPGFTKLWSETITSSIWNEDDRIRIVWITMLATVGPDGIVRSSIGGIAHMARVPREDCERAINVFLSPDPDSRSPENEGRRIQRVDGGFLILNYAKYREARNNDERSVYMAEYMREYRRKQKAKESLVSAEKILSDVNGTSVNVSLPLSTLAKAEAEAEAEADNITSEKSKVATTQNARPFWSSHEGWQNVSKLEHDFFTSFPACKWSIQLARADGWLRANPAKAKKSNWHRFLWAWFKRAQDSGGDIASNGQGRKTEQQRDQEKTGLVYSGGIKKL